MDTNGNGKTDNLIMSQRPDLLSKIHDLEGNIAKCEEELSYIYDEYSVVNGKDDMFAYRINSLEQRINQLHEQIKILKPGHTVPVRPERQQINVAPQQMQVARQMPQPQVPPQQYMPQPQVPPQQYMQQAQVPPQQRMPQSQQPPYVQQAQPNGNVAPRAKEQVQPTRVQAPRQKKDMEKTIGKSIMGVVASVLIFISFISFSALLLPFLTDEIKMAVMYLVSAAFVVVGLVLLQLKKNKILSMTLTGCGMGALYISIFLTNIYFKAIGDIPLYIMIFLWAIACCVLSKLKSKAFLIVGQIGVTISMMFGTIYCSAKEDMSMLMVLTLYYVVANTIFYLAHLDRKPVKNTINDVFLTINIFVFLMTLFGNYMHFNDCEGDTAGVAAIGLLIVIYAIAYIILNFTYMKLETNNDYADLGIVKGIIFGVTWVNFVVTLAALGAKEYMAAIPLIILALFMLILTEIKYSGGKYKSPMLDNAGRIFINVLAIVALWIATFIVKDVSEYCNMFIWIIAFTVSGFVRKDLLHKIVALVMYSVFVFSLMMNSTAYLVLGIISFAVITVFVLTDESEHFSVMVKTWSYIAFQLFLLLAINLVGDDRRMDNDITWLIVFVVMSAVNIIAMKTAYSKNKATGEMHLALKIATYAVNGILMFMTLIFMNVCETEWIHAFVIALSLVLFMLNTITFLKGKKNAFADIYVGLKFTILISCILSSYDAESYVISVFLFILAIICIVVGFVMKRKPLRIYGLVLTLLSVLKLIIFDINYDNSFGRALSLFVSGLLCFGISILYTQVDKKLSKTDEGA